jgi:hypothetical protein
MVNFQGQSLEQLANSLGSVLEGVPTRCRNSSRFTRAVLEIRAFCEGLMDLVERNHNGMAIGVGTANVQIGPEFLCLTRKVLQIFWSSC